MSSVHVEMAENLLADFMGTPDGARAFQVYVAGIRDDRWDDFYRESIHQHHWREHFPLEQIAAFAHAHSDIMSGRVAQVQLTTFGATPLRDADRAANAKALAELPRPFIADVDLDQNCADSDGHLRWVEPIRVEVSTGIPYSDPCGHEQPLILVRTIEPGSVPLEIGTTHASNTLFHLRCDRGVARWPYGHDRINLFVKLGHWQDALDGVL